MEGELWIDGSFLTEKIDPNDTDAVLVLSEKFESRASEEQFGIWDWWDEEDEPKDLFKCHTFSVVKVPPGHPDYANYLSDERYWKNFFGTSGLS